MYYKNDIKKTNPAEQIKIYVKNLSLFETFSRKSNLSSSNAGNKGELLSISETMLLTLERGITSINHSS